MHFLSVQGPFLGVGAAKFTLFAENQQHNVNSSADPGCAIAAPSAAPASGCSMLAAEATDPGAAGVSDTDLNLARPAG